MATYCKFLVLWQVNVLHCYDILCIVAVDCFLQHQNLVMVHLTLLLELLHCHWLGHMVLETL